jgi:hypothetical protein
MYKTNEFQEFSRHLVGDQTQGVSQNDPGASEFVGNMPEVINCTTVTPILLISIMLMCLEIIKITHFS